MANDIICQLYHKIYISYEMYTLYHTMVTIIIALLNDLICL
jgi:hypothetical protein